MRINVYFTNSEIEKFDEFIDLVLGLSVYNSVSVFVSYKVLLNILKDESSFRVHFLKRIKILELYDLAPIRVYNVIDNSSFINLTDNFDLSDIIVCDDKRQCCIYSQVDLTINF